MMQRAKPPHVQQRRLASLVATYKGCWWRDSPHDLSGVVPSQLCTGETPVLRVAVFCGKACKWVAQRSALSNSAVLSISKAAEFLRGNSALPRT